MSEKSHIGIVIFFFVAFGIPWTGWLLIENAALSLWFFPLFVSFAGFAAAFAERGQKVLDDFSRRVFALRPAICWTIVGMALPLLLGLAYLQTKDVAIFSLPWRNSS